MATCCGYSFRSLSKQWNFMRWQARAGISITPASFSATHGFQDCIRLNFGHPWDNRFENAIRELAEILDDPSIHG